MLSEIIRTGGSSDVLLKAIEINVDITTRRWPI